MRISSKIFGGLLIIGIILRCFLAPDGAYAQTEDYCENLSKLLLNSLRNQDFDNRLDDLIEKYKITPEVNEKVWEYCKLRMAKEKEDYGEMRQIYYKIASWWKMVIIEFTYYSFTEGKANISFWFQNSCVKARTLNKSLELQDLGKDTISIRRPRNQCYIWVTVSPEGNSDMFSWEWAVFVDPNKDQDTIRVFVPFLSKKNPFKSCQVAIFTDISGSVSARVADQIGRQKSFLKQFCDSTNIQYYCTEFGGGSTHFLRDVFTRLSRHYGYLSELPDCENKPCIRLVFILTDGIHSRGPSDHRKLSQIVREDRDSLTIGLWNMWKDVYQCTLQAGTKNKEIRNPVLILPLIVSEIDTSRKELFDEVTIKKFWCDLTSYSRAFNINDLKVNPITSFTQTLQITTFQREIRLDRCEYYPQSCSMKVYLHLEAELLKKASYPSISYRPLEASFYRPWEAFLSLPNVNMESYRELRTKKYAVIFTDDLLLYPENQPNLVLSIDKLNTPMALSLSSYPYDSINSGRIPVNWARIDAQWLPGENFVLIKGDKLIIKKYEKMGRLNTSYVYSQIGDGNEYKDCKWIIKNSSENDNEVIFELNNPSSVPKWLPLNVSGVILTDDGSKLLFVAFHKDRLYYQPYWWLVFVSSLFVFFISIALITSFSGERRASPKTPKILSELLSLIYVLFESILEILFAVLGEEHKISELPTKLTNEWHPKLTVAEVLICIGLLHIVLPIELWKPLYYIWLIGLGLVLVSLLVSIGSWEPPPTKRIIHEISLQIFILCYSGWVCAIALKPTLIEIQEPFYVVGIVFLFAIAFHALTAGREQAAQQQTP